jgi:hypothetical protein
LQATNVAGSRYWKQKVTGNRYCKQQLWQAADIASQKNGRQQILQAINVADSSYCKQQMWQAAAIASSNS